MVTKKENFCRAVFPHCVRGWDFGQRLVTPQPPLTVQLSVN